MSYQTIYNQLRANGLTETGALAMLGNWDCESNCESVRVENDFSPYRTISKQYVSDIDSNKISRDQFQHDQKGMGLSQWTFFARKAGLWDFCKNYKHCSIGNEAAQVEYAIKEMPSEAPGLLEELRTSNDLYKCTKDICCRFERPAVNNIDARVQAANRIKGMIDLNPGPSPEPTPEPEPEPEPQPTPTPVHNLELRTIDKNCSGFTEVFLLQSLLLCRRYISTDPTNVFGSWLEEAVKVFQKDAGLQADGIVGPLTWNKLMERG
jgi:peptidoglycan hydrolase-like protein with peptidoglycan-binding domain